MMKSWRRKLYGSEQWKQCRETYIKSKGGLCERCLAKGLIVPGTEVHHKQYLTETNVNDPNIALSFDNLELLCRDCHHAEHSYTVDRMHDARKHKARTNPDGSVDL